MNSAPHPKSLSPGRGTSEKRVFRGMFWSFLPFSPGRRGWGMRATSNLGFMQEVYGVIVRYDLKQSKH